MHAFHLYTRQHKPHLEHACKKFSLAQINRRHPRIYACALVLAVLTTPYQFWHNMIIEEKVQRTVHTHWYNVIYYTESVTFSFFPSFLSSPFPFPSLCLSFSWHKVLDLYEPSLPSTRPAANKKNNKSKYYLAERCSIIAQIIIIPYNGKFSREKTFTNFTVL